MLLPSSPLLFVLSVVAALLGAEGAWALFRALRARRRRAARLRLLEPKRTRGGRRGGEASLLRVEVTRSSVDRALQRLAVREAMAVELRRAGMTMSLAKFVGLSAGLSLLGFQVLALWAPALPWALPGLALGLTPWVMTRRRAFARRRRFEEQFPEALDLLIRALRAGHSLSTGLDLVGEELPDPVGGEFAQVAHEIRLGQPVKRALDNLVLRVPSPDLAFFTTAVAVQQETGSNLAEVLDKLAGVIRDRFQLLGKVRALTALGRASANLLAAWPAVMVAVLWLVNPDYLAPLWESPAGHALMILALVLVLVGYVVCRRMATIRV
jgi:tight adherence protein B